MMSCVVLLLIPVLRYHAHGSFFDHANDELSLGWSSPVLSPLVRVSVETRTNATSPLEHVAPSATSRSGQAYWMPCTQLSRATRAVARG